MSQFTDNQEFYIYPHSVNQQQLIKGVLRPIRMKPLPCDTCLITVDSKNRTAGTDYNFTCSTQKAIVAPLKAQVSRASIPKIPNINANDNVISIVHSGITGGAFSVTIPIGYYNQNSLVTAMQNAINVKLTSLGSSDQFLVAFNPTNKTISVTSNNGDLWFFSNQSSFSKYGSNVANFPAFDPSLNPSVIGQKIWYSGNAGLLYSRYVAISSNILCAHAYDTSRTTGGLFNTIATISMVNQYDASDFSVNGVYEGNLMLDSTTEVSSVLNLAQSGAQIQVIDFRLTDEYGFDLGTSLTLGPSPEGPPYNASELGCLLWITIYL